MGERSSPTGEGASAWLQKAWTQFKCTRFGRDVIARPSIGKVAAWLLVAVTSLVWFLAYKYAPNAIPPDPICGPLPASHPIAPGVEACIPTPESKIPELWGWIAVVGVTLAALTAGWAPIVSRNWRGIDVTLRVLGTVATAVGAGWAAYTYWPMVVSQGFFASGWVRWPIAVVAGFAGGIAAIVIWALTVNLQSLLRPRAGFERRSSFARVMFWPVRMLWFLLRAVFSFAAVLPSAILSAVDFALVRGWAVLLGTTVDNILLRYLVLSFWIGGAVYVGWRFPAPLGAFAVVIGFVSVFAVLRRWSWIEADRAEFIVRRGSKEEIERIGFGQDLRDEALTALVLLFILIPLALRQADSAFHLFHPVGAALPSLASWVGFFGGELAKAVPLVDWSEVFGVANGSQIEAITPAGAVSVFVLRATLDLVLITSVLQAVEIAVRLREQREAYTDGHLDLIDPFAERREFRAAAPLVPAWDYLYQGLTLDALPGALRAYQLDRLKVVARGVAAKERVSSPVQVDTRARLTATHAIAVRSRETSADDLAAIHPPRMEARGPFALADALTARIFPQEPPPDLRPIAFRQIVTTSPSPEALLAACLEESRPPWLRTLAAAELGRRRSRPATEALVAIAKSQGADIQLRAHSATALAKLDWSDTETLVRQVSGALERNASPLAVHTLAYGAGRLGKVRNQSLETSLALLPAGLHAQALRAVRSGRGEADCMARIPAGAFEMGSTEFSFESPVHRVTVPEFELGVFAVTFEEYDDFVRATRRRQPNDGGWGRDRRPVIDVSWHDANAYAGWLSGWTGEVWRLPSEAEWEYACRAGSTTKYSFGDDPDALRVHAWFSENSEGKTQPVGEKTVNAYGLHDMHGNVWEWCADTWHGGYEGAPVDGSVWLNNRTPYRVYRGGSCYSYPRYLRSAYRSWGTPADRNYSLGFRVARTL